LGEREDRELIGAMYRFGPPPRGIAGWLRNRAWEVDEPRRQASARQVADVFCPDTGLAYYLNKSPEELGALNRYNFRDEDAHHSTDSAGPDGSV